MYTLSPVAPLSPAVELPLSFLCR